MKAVVIGGGIIGLFSAYYLRKTGWKVTVLDDSAHRAGCSYGNLGMIVPSHFVPLASPGIVAQGLRWMLNRKSPFYVRPTPDPHLISWGLRFLKNATAQHVEKSAMPLLQLNLYSKKLYGELSRQPGFDFALENKGILMYYKTGKVQKEEAQLAEKARAMGLDAVVLDRQGVQGLEPGTELDVLGAVHYRSDAHLYPDRLMPQLYGALSASGVEVRSNERVQKIMVRQGEIKKILTMSDEYEPDLTIMAAGAWLEPLAAMAGVQIPLMPGKGYSITYVHPARRLQVPAILCEARVAITPMNGTMRYGGTMEIGKINKKVNLPRVEGILASVSDYFPGIQPGLPPRKDIWFGFRPCSPDGLPYIGRTVRIRNLIIAGGHAMMGLSLGPATGKIVADLANEVSPELPLGSFDPERFAK